MRQETTTAGGPTNGQKHVIEKTTIFLDINMMHETLQLSLQNTHKFMDNYDKNVRPSPVTEVIISLYINRISAVDENKEEISFDVFLQVIWQDTRIEIANESKHLEYVELTAQERHKIWVPDLYIRQLREMKVLTLFEEISSLRLYQNSTITLSIGATIIIKCDMDFILFPLDVQKCPIDFSSYKYSVKEMKFHWKHENALSFPKDFGEGFFRLPKYIVTFRHRDEPYLVNYGDAEHHSARLEIKLTREVKSYLLENYLPSTLFVCISWGSFVVAPEWPGRMVLLVTVLLSLVTMFDTIRNNSPEALELKSIEVWLISCTLFVFLSLMEYFIILFGMRYDKHWRHAKKKIQETKIASPRLLHVSEGPRISTESPRRRNGLEAARMLAGGGNKISPEPKTNDTLQPPDANISISTETLSAATQKMQNIMTKNRFKNVADVALLYAGSQRGRLDQISLILFPISFLMFTTIYWAYYLTEARKRS
ncbi:glycine receptor subunit alpha-4-like [Culicoides brevitarsis]|uniref:glycine receptor subunit alpha-4-like n=1 Tax=Culicoides brevitarsis TaxID=469753 RepID=UPI00307B7721